MAHDIITQIRIAGLRTIADLTLDLAGLTVLIGDNGTGKSSIIEALELLRLASKQGNFVSDTLQRKHGGFVGLLRHGAESLKLGVTIEGNGPKLEYDFTVVAPTSGARVSDEQVLMHHPQAGVTVPALLRVDAKAVVFDLRNLTFPVPVLTLDSPGGDQIPAGSIGLALAQLGIGAQPALRRVIDALAKIEVQVPFETRPTWQQADFPNRAGPRWPVQVETVEALARYAENLPNCFFTLRNQGGATWDRVVDRTRLGLGHDFREFQFPVANRGQIELELRFARDPDHPLRLDSLSEGQVAYLAFVAMVELNRTRSLLAFDEPEINLHPALLTRVMYMFEQVAERSPVLLSTHSDRLLDILEDPAKSVVLCDLDEHGATRLRRPNAEALADWLKDYDGLGALRARGYEAHVFDAGTGKDGDR